MSARPLVGRSRPRMMRIVVDLPAPLGPRKPVTTPGGTVKLSRSTATVLPYLLVRSWTSIMRLPAGGGGPHPPFHTSRADRHGIGSATSSAEHLPVDLEGAVGDRRPGELLDRPPTSGSAHGPRTLGVLDHLGQRLAEVGDEAVGVDRRAGAVLYLLDRHQQTGDAVVHDLRDPAR